MKAKFLRSLLPLAIVLTMVSCASSDETQPSNDTTVVSEYDYTETEMRLVQLINDHRTSVGLNSLETINHISYKSSEHNEYMIENDVVNHDYFYERSQNIIHVLGAEKVGENVAYNYLTPEGAMHAWLNSPSHKVNIEGDYTHFGISIKEDPETGKKYYTNIFMKR